MRRGRTAASLDVFDDALREYFRLGEIIEVGEAVVFQPEEVEAGLVACGQLSVRELPPAAGGIFLGVPRFLPLVAVLRIVARDELGEIVEAERLPFQRVVDVGAVVVIPNLGRGGSFARGAVVEEEHVGLHAVGVEDARRQAQDGMQLRRLHEPLADGRAGAALEEDVVGQHHGGAAMCLRAMN